MSGLDKSENLARARAVREEENEVEPLNPDFPYVVIPFDFDFFSIPANPPVKFDSQE